MSTDKTETKEKCIRCCITENIRLQPAVNENAKYFYCKSCYIIMIDAEIRTLKTLKTMVEEDTIWKENHCEERTDCEYNKIVLDGEYYDEIGRGVS